MTLDEAIRHLYIKIKTSDMCDECLVEHFQLYMWLLELEALRRYTGILDVRMEVDRYNQEHALDKMKEYRL